MNRHQRRTEAAKARVAASRRSMIRDALSYMAAAGDPSITGATLVLPSGEALHLSADTARAMAPGSTSTAGSRP